MKLFNDFFKNKNAEEVIDVVNVNIDMGNTVAELLMISKKILHKKISFYTHPMSARTSIYNRGKEITTTVKRTEFILVNDDQWTFLIWDEENKYQIDFNKPEIKIWGKRFYSESDPYGEEDWEK